MIHKIIFATNSNEDSLQQFQNILLMAGVQTKHLKSENKLNCFESTWDDANSPKMVFKGNAGAKPKQLTYNGESVTCGVVYQLRNCKYLSDAEIGSLFDISESTITRRRKKHISNGDFYDGSSIIF